MNVDEALIEADEYSSLAPTTGKHQYRVLQVLAAEVRRQHTTLEAMRSFCACPCCGGVDQCTDECTLADDDPNEAARLEAMREVLR